MGDDTAEVNVNSKANDNEDSKDKRSVKIAVSISYSKTNITPMNKQFTIRFTLKPLQSNNLLQ